MTPENAARLHKIWAWVVLARLYMSRVPTDDLQWLIDDYKRLDAAVERKDERIVNLERQRAAQRP